MPPALNPAEFSAMVQLVRVSEELSLQYNPPPYPATFAVAPVTELPLMMQFVKVAKELT